MQVLGELCPSGYVWPDCNHVDLKSGVTFVTLTQP